MSVGFSINVGPEARTVTIDAVSVNQLIFYSLLLFVISSSNVTSLCVFLRQHRMFRRLIDKL